MGKIENFKQKVKENKGKIVATSVTVAGVVGVIVYQGDKIKKPTSGCGFTKRRNGWYRIGIS